MYYYHGSDKLFTEFDVKFSEDVVKVMHLTPHRQYATHFAKPYLYTVLIEGFENIEYRESMSNVSFTSCEKLTIIDVCEI